MSINNQLLRDHNEQTERNPRENASLLAPLMLEKSETRMREIRELSGNVI